MTAERVRSLRTELAFLEETGRTARAAQVRSILADLEQPTVEATDASAATPDTPAAEDGDTTAAELGDGDAAVDSDQAADKPVKRRR